MPSTKDDERATRGEELNEAEQKALNRFEDEPAAFQDLVDEGLMDRATAAAVRHRLVERGLVKKIGYKPSPRPRGRPRVLYALARPDRSRRRRKTQGGGEAGRNE